jgi:hypothetical protein
MDKNNNTLSRRCPRLGGPVNFSYCETCDENQRPCFKIFDCWWEFFDVVSYMKQHLTTEQFNNLCGKRPKPKVVSIIDLIQKAKNAKDG